MSRLSSLQGWEPSTWHIAAFSATLAFLVNVGALWNGFAYDDVVIVEQNAMLRSGESLWRLVSAPYWPKGELYRPLTMLTLAIDWRIGGGAPWVLHLGTLLWHALVAALVTLLALRWLPAYGALLAGAIFALHPVHVEVAANIVGRSESLAAAALMGVALIAGRRDLDGSRRRAFLMLLGLAAMASKEIGIAAPVIAFAAALGARRSPGAPRLIGGTGESRWALRDRNRTEGALQGEERSWAGVLGAPWRYWRGSVEAAAAAGAGVLLVLVARVMVLGEIAGHHAHPAFEAATPVQAIALSFHAAARATWLLTIPRAPRPDYSPSLAELIHPNWVTAAIGVLLLVLLAALAFRHLRAPSLYTFAAVLALATYAPASNIVHRSGGMFGERALYSPSIALALAGASLIVAAHRLWPRAGVRLATAVTAWFALAAWHTVGAVPTWRDNDALAASMIALAPGSYQGYLLRAERRASQGDLAGAWEDSRRGIASFPHSPQLLASSARLRVRMNDREGAASLLSRAVALDPDAFMYRDLLVQLQLRLGAPEMALFTLEEGLRHDPQAVGWQRLRDSLRLAARADSAASAVLPLTVPEPRRDGPSPPR